jgi:hypothetical protein
VVEFLIFDWQFLICFYHTPSSTIALRRGGLTVIVYPQKSKIANQKYLFPLKPPIFISAICQAPEHAGNRYNNECRNDGSVEERSNQTTSL